MFVDQPRDQRYPTRPADQEDRGQLSRPQSRSVGRRPGELDGPLQRIRDQPFQVVPRDVRVGERRRERNVGVCVPRQGLLRTTYVVAEDPAATTDGERTPLDELVPRVPVALGDERTHMVEQRLVDVGAAEPWIAPGREHLETGVVASGAGKAPDDTRVDGAATEVEHGDLPTRAAAALRGVVRRGLPGHEGRRVEHGRRHRFRHQGDLVGEPRGGLTQYPGAHRSPVRGVGEHQEGDLGIGRESPGFGDGTGQHRANDVDHAQDRVTEQQFTLVDASLGVRFEPGRVHRRLPFGLLADEQRAVGGGVDGRRQQRVAVDDHDLGFPTVHRRGNTGARCPEVHRHPQSHQPLPPVVVGVYAGTLSDTARQHRPRRAGPANVPTPGHGAAVRGRSPGVGAVRGRNAPTPEDTAPHSGLIHETCISCLPTLRLTK